MKPLRIAVADDEPDIRTYFSRMLSRLGHEVVAVAENGRQLVTLCREQQPDLVITDLRMPEMSGIDATEQIAKERDVPVIWISAHQLADMGPDARSTAMRCRVICTLVKPVTLRDLARAVELAINTFQGQHEVG